MNFQNICICNKVHIDFEGSPLPIPGASKECFRQFKGSKEFSTFLDKFWTLGKQDQDALVVW